MRLSSDVIPSPDDVISTQCVLPADFFMAVMGHFLVKCYETTQNPPIGTDFRRLGLYSLNQ
jgi:hypothetical protein